MIYTVEILRILLSVFLKIAIFEIKLCQYTYNRRVTIDNHYYNIHRSGMFPGSEINHFQTIEY